MHEGSFVFAQLASYLDRNKFNYLFRKYQGDSYIKHFGDSVTRSNLAKANQNRDYRIFEEFAHYMGGVKQHLKIKKFWGDSENAVRIQIYSAIISYCLVAIVHHKMKLETSVYNALQVIGISLTDTTPLIDLFNKSNLSIDKELDGFYEPMLFDF